MSYESSAVKANKAIEVRLGGNGRLQTRQDVPAECCELGLLVAAHQVDIELSYPDRRQLLEPANVFIRGPDHGEPVHDLVRDEFSIRASNFCMMQVIVPLAAAHVG